MNLLRHLREEISRYGVHGDRLTRAQSWVARGVPFFIEPLLVAGWAAVFYLICRPARLAILSNLKVLFPKASALSNWFRGYEVIRSFSVSLTDGIRSRNGEDVIEWEIRGRSYLDELMAGSDGAVLLTAHMGSHDLAARLFAERTERKIHAVRAPERNAAAQEMREKDLKSGAADNLAIRYNRPDGFLAVDLLKAISGGDIVAIQGDRIVFEVAPHPVSHPDGFCLQVPKGPFVLAATARSPIYPVFTFRTGFRKYCVLALEPVICERRRGDAQEAAIESAAQRWVGTLVPVIRQNWSQWFVFEPAFVDAEPRS